MLRFSYPASLVSSGEGFVVTFRDVPEAVTGGDTPDEALRSASDALAVALAGYIEAGKSIPDPTPKHFEETVVTVPPARAGALLIQQAIHPDEISIAEMSARLNKPERHTRRVLSGRARLDDIIAALEALGLRVELRVVPLDHVGVD
jgi:antitoxin HicB